MCYLTSNCTSVTQTDVVQYMQGFFKFLYHPVHMTEVRSTMSKPLLMIWPFNLIANMLSLGHLPV